MTGKSVEVALPNGQKGTATELDITNCNERWNEYTLEDGTTFRAKLSIISVLKADDHRDQNGHPLLIVNGITNIVVVKSDGSSPASASVTASGG